MSETDIQIKLRALGYKLDRWQHMHSFHDLQCICDCDSRLPFIRTCSTKEETRYLTPVKKLGGIFLLVMVSEDFFQIFFKLIACLVTFAMVLSTGIVSKGSLLFMTSQMGKNVTGSSEWKNNGT